MEESKKSKHDTRKVLRNNHSGFSELQGFYSSLWLYVYMMVNMRDKPEF